MRGFVCFPTSSIGRKQLVAATGVLLLLFVIGHVAGNLSIFAGPDTFNGYAATLEKLQSWLYFIEAALALIAVVHIAATIMLVVENIQARGRRYRVYQSLGERTVGSRIMPYTGSLILIFVVLHIRDFTFADRTTRAIVNGEDLGLFGVVYNSFQNPVHAGAYILVMMALGLHLTHAIQAALQTFGVHPARYIKFIKILCVLFGIAIALLYISIPVAAWLDIMKP